MCDIRISNEAMNDLLAEADNLISAALGIGSGSQGYCIFIAARDEFRRRLVAEFLHLDATEPNLEIKH